MNENHTATESQQDTLYFPEKSKAFQAPAVWMDPRELQSDYWQDEKNLERQEQEFFHKPIETLDFIEKLPTFETTRRNFLKVMGAGIALTSAACARPRSKIIPYVNKPVETTPGVPTYYASTCMECSKGCGTLVKTRESRPIKLEGNPDARHSAGKICVKGQASLLNLYDPDRLRAPVINGNPGNWSAQADPKSQMATFYDAVDGVVLPALTHAKRVRVLTSVQTGPAYLRLMGEFLQAFPDGRHVMWESNGPDDLVEAQERSYGKGIIPHYRFEEADVVVSLGADFLGDWLNPTVFSASWAQKRNLQGQKPSQAQLSKVMVFESHFSLTGASSDDRFSIRAGDELRIALGLAHEIIIKRRISSWGGNSALSQVLSKFTLENVAQDTGLALEDLHKVAQSLAQSRGRSLVVGGSLQARTANAVALQMVINLLNSALENEGKTVDGSRSASRHTGSWKNLLAMMDEMNKGLIDVLIIHRSNPLYALPESLGFADAMKKVPLTIAFSEAWDETARLSQVVIPDGHYLENWGDAEPSPGVYSFQQPAIAPMYASLCLQDALLRWSNKASLKTTGLVKQESSQNEYSWHDYLRKHWQQKSGTGSAEEFWQECLRKGVWQSQVPALAGRSFQVQTLIQNLPATLPKSEETSLVLYSKNHMGDGRHANNAWLQELPAATSSVTWDNYLNMSPSRARAEKIQQNDVVTLKVGGQSLDVPVNVQPGMHPSVLSLAVGYGRSAAGSVGNGVGVNAFSLIQMNGSQPVFAGQSVTFNKTGRKHELARTQEHHRTLARPITNDITLADYQKNPRAENHHDPHLRLPEEMAKRDMWNSGHEASYSQGYRWGMAIDLNSCNGCNACVVACQAENNIPTVGRDQVLVSREMHWLRIDRYYSGDEDRPQTAFHPVMCQHCENASCETVCPVLATVHNDEGLNDMTYNRCVGTRYCQNNCPYKVRRFNFFDNWLRSKDGPLDLVWNPDVTLRSRGIMEKCTFCTQRINSAKIGAKAEGRKVKDADLQTACQQACPSNAIYFGNVNDQQSKVAKLRQDPRSFTMLEILNNKPQVTYLTRVRNAEVSYAQGSVKGDDHAHDS